MDEKKEMLVVGDENDGPKMDEKTEALVKAIRQNPSRFRKILKRKPYFSENNHEEAVGRMLKYRLGRRARRNLARKMCVTWTEYLLIEDIVMESMIKLDEATKPMIAAWIDRKYQQYRNKKISIRDLRSASIIARGYSFEEAEEMIKIGSDNCLGDDIDEMELLWTLKNWGDENA